MHLHEWVILYMYMFHICIGSNKLGVPRILKDLKKLCISYTYTVPTWIYFSLFWKLFKLTLFHWCELEVWQILPQFLVACCLLELPIWFGCVKLRTDVFRNITEMSSLRYKARSYKTALVMGVPHGSNNRSYIVP